MKKQLYLAIKNRLKNIPGADGEPLFKHFDLWNQQVEFIEQETPFQTPAIFVEFQPLQWRTLGNRVQDADLTTRLHIVTEWNALTADYAPEEEEALEYLEIVDSVVTAMHEFTAPNTNTWMRTQTIPNHNHERYVDSVEEYICKVVDNSANTPMTGVNGDVIVPEKRYVTLAPVVTKDND